MKKILLLIIAASIVVTCFACGGKKDKGDGSKVETNAPSIDPWDELPEVSYDGQKFRICTRTNGYNTMEVLADDEASTDILDIALSNRNSMVEDEFGVKITPVVYGGGAGEQINDVITACVSNQDIFDIAMTYVFESAPLIVNGFVYNWNQFDYTHLDRSYWMNDMNKEFAIKDVIYTTVGKMCVSTITNTYAFFYNRSLGESFKPELTQNMFSLIRNGNWTWDEMLKIVDDFGWSEGDDINGSSDGDTFAMRLGLDFSIDIWHAAWDIPMVKNNPETGLENVYMSNKLLSFADRMHEAYYNNTSVYAGGDYIKSFTTGKSLFINGRLSFALGSFTDMVDIYTIIPYPKYDENQENYRTGAADNYSVMSVPVTANSEFVSIIVEALNIQSEKILYPAYYYEALHKKTISDPDTNEMLDIVLNNMAWDIGTLLHEELHLMDIVRLDVIRKENNVKGTYDSMKQLVDDSLLYIMEQFEEFQQQ